MPAQPPVREPEEEMEAGESQLPEANGEVEEPQENEGRRGGGGEETMEESMEERESDLEESEEEEEEEEEEESSEMDDEDCERRRGECLDEMLDLEKQFQELKEKLFRERLNQVKVKLDEVLTGKAGEYREPLAALQNSMQIRTQVAGVYRELCLQVIKHKHECEVQGARQHLESERTLLKDAMKTELLEKIRRLEEDRQNIDLTSEWSDEMRGKKCKRKNLLGRSERKKKVALVSGPFIVYMLKDIDILEDWTAIKKAKALSPLKRKLKSGDDGRVPAAKTPNLTHTHSQLLPLTVTVLCLRLKPSRLLCDFFFPAPLTPATSNPLLLVCYLLLFKISS